MGKKKNNQASAQKLFCYWCDKAFDQDEHLIKHQVAKHFRCPHCRTGNAGQCITLESLVMHFRKLHRAELLTVPNAKQGRNDPIASQHIYGMDNVPEETLNEWYSNTALPQFATTTTELIEAMAPPKPQKDMHLPPPQPSEPTETLMEEPAPATDWAELAKQWMNAKKPAEEEADMEIEEAPEPNRFSESSGPPIPEMWQPEDSAPSLPFQGFSFSRESRTSQVDASAANKIAAFAQTAKLSVAAAGMTPAPEVSLQQMEPWASTSAAAGQSQPPSNRSPSRSRRSRSWNRRGRSRSGYNRRGRSRSRGGRGSPGRNRRDDRGRDDRPRESRPSWRPPPSDDRGGKGGGGNNDRWGGGGEPMEQRTIQITEGVVRSRLQLKSEMERFGRVETVYMGNRHDPQAEPPLVRFQTSANAASALEAINAGSVLFDGLTVKAAFKTDKRRPMQRDIEREVDQKLHITSRDFARDDRRRNYGNSRW